MEEIGFDPWVGNIYPVPDTIHFFLKNALA